MQRFHRGWIAAVFVAIGAGMLVSQAEAQAPAPAYEGYADLPGVRIWYKDTGGSGVPVVFLHAGTGSVRVWEHQVPAFTAAGYRFIAFDRRGWGRTEVLPTGSQPGTAAEDLDRLMDHLHVDRFHIVATAAGGSIAWDYALSYPKRLRSMVIANNTGRVEDQAYLDLVASLKPKLFDELPPEFREVGPVYRASNPEGTRRWVELEKMSRPPGPRLPTQPLKSHLTFEALESVETPVLMIAGGSDLAAPAPLQHFFSDRVRHVETLLVPNAGHSTFWERPDVFNRAVLEFIRKH